MTRYMLDTNIVSAALRGHADLDDRLQRLDPAAWCISAITRAELRYGLALKPAAVRLAELVDAFLQAAVVASWDAAAADAHGILRAELKRRGTPIGVYDEMIGAHALALDAVLVTDNVQHFERIPGLRWENWLRQSGGH